jgi:hypothetical protein
MSAGDPSTRRVPVSASGAVALAVLVPGLLLALAAVAGAASLPPRLRAD